MSQWLQGLASNYTMHRPGAVCANERYLGLLNDGRRRRAISGGGMPKPASHASQCSSPRSWRHT